MDHLTAMQAESHEAPSPAEFTARLDAHLDETMSPELAERWRRQGHVDRDFWRAFGHAGFLCVSIPRRYGGQGGDFRLDDAVIGSLMRHGAAGFAAPLHSSVVAPYLANYAPEHKRLEWLPKAAAGELVLAIAMTEPGAGSDLQAIRTTAVADGDGYRINGQKTFISNGRVADLVVVACKTGGDAGAKGISLIAVETDRPGFERGRVLEKLGQHARDTGELFFRDLWVPGDNLLGAEGEGFAMLMENLPQERMVIACQALAMMELALARTTAMVRGLDESAETALHRAALGAGAAETAAGRAFVAHCLERLVAGTLDAATAAMAKLWVTEAQARLLDGCLAIFEACGDAGALADLYHDARAYRLYGGTTEIMKTIIGRTIARA